MAHSQGLAPLEAGHADMRTLTEATHEELWAALVRPPATTVRHHKDSTGMYQLVERVAQPGHTPKPTVLRNGGEITVNEIPLRTLRNWVQAARRTPRTAHHARGASTTLVATSA